MHRKAFAVSSFLLLLMVGAIALNNYNREWKQYQRQYYAELMIQKEAELVAAQGGAGEGAASQNASLLDQLAALAGGALDALGVETQLSMQKVVTEAGRSADMCMTCHVNQGVPGFSEQPLVNLYEVHPDYIIQHYPFDQVGCTACHGGQPLALTTEKAHEGLADTVESFFLMKVQELRAPNWIVRQKAIERIRWMTGDDFGYAQDADELEMEVAIARMLDWWALHKYTFFTEGFGDRPSPFKTKNPQAEHVKADPRLSPAGRPLDYVANAACVGCHNGLYNERMREAQAAGNQESIDRIQQQLDHIGQWTTIDLGGITLADEAFAGVVQDYSCQACHGPGDEYVQLMQKGLALLYQGKGIESSELLKKASEIARANARLNLSDPNIWALLQQLTARGEAAAAASVQPTVPAKPIQPAQTPLSEEALIEQGASLAGAQGCLACHTVDGGAGAGPSWMGLFGKTETLSDGATVNVDEAYLVESITQPNAKVVQGFAAAMPPYALSQDQLDALVAYIKSLSAE